MPASSLPILYRDANLVVVDKPSGLLVHPSPLARDRVTCMSLLRDQLGLRVYPAHRLDRGASGVLVFALSPEDAALVTREFASRNVVKRYLAIVRGWAPYEALIDYPLREEDAGDRRHAEAVTRVACRARVELQIATKHHPTSRYSLVEAEPRTGRRHQIRRHLAHLRHPIIGDHVHGDGWHNRLFRDSFGVERLLLHASGIEFAHPVSGRRLATTSPLPAAFISLFEHFGWARFAATHPGSAADRCRRVE